MDKRKIYTLQLNFIPIPPALLILALTILTAGACVASAGMDIDYSHNLVGTGTVMSDFNMGSDEGTKATGRVRGSGEVMNKYVFFSNNSENVTIEDQFFFASAPVAREIAVSDYPHMTMIPGSFRMLGATWAAKMNITLQNDSKQKFKFRALPKVY